jgi:hypothetical protein
VDDLIEAHGDWLPAYHAGSDKSQGSEIPAEVEKRSHAVWAEGRSE